jgi:hypothetical protein
VVEEEMEGWDEFVAELESRFGVSLDQWFSIVAFPAFARNLTILWSTADLGLLPALYQDLPRTRLV